MDYTKIIHQEPQVPTGSNRPLVPPIFQSVKFTASSVAELDDIVRHRSLRYVYSRVSNPTVRQLEVLLAEMQGCEDCICTSTGMAAVSTALLTLLSAGDHMVMFYESYKPARMFVHNILARFGVEVTLASIGDLSGLKKSLRPGKTRLVLFESPTNPIVRVADVQAISNICREAGVLTVLDNTAAGFHNYGQFDIDLYIHSLTKYASGHGDVLGGAIIGSDALLKKMRIEQIDIGCSLDANSAFLINRGMKTYPLRYQRQVDTAESLAKNLATHPKVKKIIYPGLPSHPDRHLVEAQLKDPGTILAIYLDGGQDEVTRFMDALKIFQISSSFGSPESLVAPVMTFFGGDLRPEERRLAGIEAGTLRLAVGLEDADDLWRDLESALAAF